MDAAKQSFKVQIQRKGGFFVEVHAGGGLEASTRAQKERASRQRYGSACGGVVGECALAVHACFHCHT